MNQSKIQASALVFFPLIHFSIVSSLELSNTKVWLTLGEIDGLKLEVHNPESSVLDRKTKGTVYFEKRNVAVSHIRQTFSQRHGCSSLTPG